MIFCHLQKYFCQWFFWSWNGENDRLLFFERLAKKRSKRNPIGPLHGLARNFATKLPPNNSLEKYSQALYRLKLSRATSIRNRRFHCVQISPAGFFTPAAKNPGKSDIHPLTLFILLGRCLWRKKFLLTSKSNAL
jgi:hypothetical protein